ncbi:Zinc finger, CHC2-type [uncultured Caudovirales phage]|uniref:Zinc finger, CHC2-type n=1 Tax=uncultured Caudovirales phage TaxID=2100421 RepID=A0A6J5RTZ2_9CAUD|nr:Zinc finger, CHC2-type [uncultured Caudovirales phage]
MRNVPDTTGCFGYGEAPGENRDFTNTIKNKLEQANSVPIVSIFKYYGLRLSASNCYAICPFKSHKNGRESTASFKYYDETNSFFCHGCSIGGNATRFVSVMDDTSIVVAADKIIKLFSDNIDNNSCFLIENNYSERLEILLDLSDAVRDFQSTFLDDKSREFIELRCRAFDGTYKSEMNNESLRWSVDFLKEQIKIFIKLNCKV